MKTCSFCETSLAGMRDAARRKYCSRECMINHRLQNPLTNKSTAHYRARRKKKSSCERCGEKSNLQVHHKDRNPLNDSKSNLETLCQNCHSQEHEENRMSLCAVCGVEFRAASHRNRNKICSAPCAKEWGRINAQKRWHPGQVSCAALAMPSSRHKQKSSSGV